MSWRREFGDEFARRFAWLVRHRRMSVLIELIKLVNAVWFAGIWQAGLMASRAMFIWLGFFVVTMALALWLELKINKEESNG